MESFLASRATVAKLGSSVKNLTGTAFTPMGAPKPGAPMPTANQPANGPVEAGAAKPLEPHAEHAVKVEVVQENGVVGKIVVHCRCGERIELDCLYPG